VLKTEDNREKKSTRLSKKPRGLLVQNHFVYQESVIMLGIGWGKTEQNHRLGPRLRVSIFGSNANVGKFWSGGVGG